MIYMLGIQIMFLNCSWVKKIYLIRINILFLNILLLNYFWPIKGKKLLVVLRRSGMLIIIHLTELMKVNLASLIVLMINRWLTNSSRRLRNGLKKRGGA